MTLKDIEAMYEGAPKSTADNLFMAKSLLQNKELSMNEKFYVAIIYSYHNNPVLLDKWLNEAAFSRPWLIRTKHHLRSIGLSDLLNLVLPCISSAEEAKDFVIRHSHKGLKCEWCGKESYILHKHHFPKLRKHGGNSVVNICPNCHATFHAVYKGE